GRRPRGRGVGAQPRDQPVHDPVDGAEHDFFLAREVDVDGPLADAGRLRHVVHRRLRVAEHPDEALGGVEDQVPGPRRVHGGVRSGECNLARFRFFVQHLFLGPPAAGSAAGPLTRTRRGHNLLLQPTYRSFRRVRTRRRDPFGCQAGGCCGSRHLRQFVAAAGLRRRPPVRTDAVGLVRPLAVALVLFACSAPALRAQEADSQELRVQGFSPTGPRSSLTESAGTLAFTVVNFDATDKDARVVVFYPAHRAGQHARAVGAPAGPPPQPWLPVGPAPAAAPNLSREIEMRLYDRTGGAERLIPPAGEERVRSR